MWHFILGFTVYTLGTVGILVLGYVIAKHFLNSTPYKGNDSLRKFLKIEQSISLEPRKGLYIVKAGTQRFLIATTPENVSFLSELNRDNVVSVEYTSEPEQKPSMHPDLESKLAYINFIKDALHKDQIKR